MNNIDYVDAITSAVFPTLSYGLDLTNASYSTLTALNKYAYKTKHISGTARKFTYAGGFNTVNMDESSVNSFYITKVIYNNPATIVFFSDGTKTVSKAHNGDTYNPEFGFLDCIIKKLVGNTNVRELLKSWVTSEAYTEKCTEVDNALVRKNNKKK